MSDFLIRPANPNDVPGIAFVHYTSWVETYTGLIDDAYLKTLSVERQLKRAGNELENVTVAEMDGEIVGFCRCGACRDEDASSCGEIATIYILKKAQGMGIGRVLTEKALSMLSASGYTQCKLWALANNEHAAGFYKKMGFAPDGGETFLQLGSPARCIRFTRALP